MRIDGGLHRQNQKMSEMSDKKSNRDIRDYLNDISEMIGDIEDFTAGKPDKKRPVLILTRILLSNI
ncbi:MAG: hypothetical protein DRI57_28710 [Deltaproteobacteria bacterium]|nr:MAG: hypothetical protein DRI57_28710 [Deltaproteobacteria bacterium]